jgi:FtsZ-interacting cell division protein ZipA
MNKNIIIGIIVVAILVLGGLWWMRSNKSSGPAPLPAADTTGAIIEDADALDLGDLDQEFQDIDRDLQTL